MKDNISGKSILLVCQQFFGYEQRIKETLLELGAKDVYWQDVRWFQESFREHITWKTPLFYMRNPLARTKWTKEIYRDIEDKQIDVLLCIENTPFKKWYIKKLKQKNPAMKTILFLWDTHDVQKIFMDYLSLFDKIYSFDRDDCARYDFEYWPDFYIDEKCNADRDDCQYDLAFVSKCQPFATDFRARLLARIDDFCIENGLKTFFHLKYSPKTYSNNIVKRWISEHGRFRRYYNMIDSLSYRNWLNDYALPLEQVELAYDHAKTILDLSYPHRQGMTLNCIASIAKGKKLITTNYRIKDESFYDPNNIWVIDGNNPVLNLDFFKTKPIKIDITHLRLDNWLKHIINGSLIDNG
ncbi:hypothetical protein H6B13_16150 [Bacteroides gallinaceum]|uniref:hypothetical protein n=1 Tax=Bacteroides gallinaceum TaxID=1462571 RepID=UPI00195B3736|nr:hypothetical protein [Bacteroides gallinaceum]MBM6721147.1 hypothetical protein [Bacteroides gallinaceum]